MKLVFEKSYRLKAKLRVHGRAHRLVYSFSISYRNSRDSSRLEFWDPFPQRDGEEDFSIYTLIFKTLYASNPTFFLLTIKFLEDFPILFTFLAFLILPSGSSTLCAMELFQQRPMSRSLGSHWKPFFRLFYDWTLFIGLSSLIDVFFCWFLTCHSLLIFGLICWPFNHLLNISILQDSVLGPLSSPPSLYSLANIFTLMVSANTT